MKKTVLSLRSKDYEALAVASKLILNRADRPARVSLTKSVKDGTADRTYGVDIIFDVYDKDLIEILQRTDFTSNVEVSFRDIK